VKRNSVAVVEGRFRVRSTWDLDAPFVVEGNDVQSSGPGMYNGNSFNVSGGATNPGIATIDTNPLDGIHPASIVTSPLAKNQANNITGVGGTPRFRISRRALRRRSAIAEGPRLSLELVNNVLPSAADNLFTTDQHWSAPISFDMGSVDITKPMNDRVSGPRLRWLKEIAASAATSLAAGSLS